MYAWSEHFFLITLGVIILTFIVIFATNQKQFLIVHAGKISLVFAILQFAYFWDWTILWLSRLEWREILLKDLCPLVAFISIPVFILNKEKYYKLIMPWLIIGSMVTLSVGSSTWNEDFWSWIFNWGAHSLMLIQGICAYIWIKKYEIKELWKNLVFPAGMIIWILLAGYTPWQVTGDSNWAFYSTGMLAPAIVDASDFGILGTFGVPYPWATILFYLLAVIISCLIVLNKIYHPIYWPKVVKQSKITWDKIIKKMNKQKHQ